MKAAPAARDGVPSEDVLRRIRIPFVRRAQLSRHGVSEEIFIIDLGLLGVFVEHPAVVPIGEPVMLRFPLPGNEIPLEAECRVAWRHDPQQRLVSKQLPPGLGLEFVELEEQHHARIREHVLDHVRRHPRVRRFLRHWPEADRAGDDP
jgi:hypothetical protein